eukprot:2928319-Alexandrium_andersonii.AAC.1
MRAEMRLMNPVGTPAVPEPKLCPPASTCRRLLTNRRRQGVRRHISFPRPAPEPCAPGAQGRQKTYNA